MLDSIDQKINSKFELIKKIKFLRTRYGRIRRLNHELNALLSILLTTERSNDRLQLRKLLKQAMLVNPRDRTKILKYLRFMYTELERIEEHIEKLKELTGSENTILTDKWKSRSMRLEEIKAQLEDINSQQQTTSDKIREILTEINHELNSRLLMEYFGHETRYKCPKCGMRFVKVEKVQVRENPRMHSYTFYCHFCDHMEETSDVSLDEVSKRWS
ncbi:MAG: hypothetical protein KJ922_04655 [Nanoarchaeota archaeon]|nr:hypothetical protein [Nanoarchaeota archaeon]